MSDIEKLVQVMTTKFPEPLQTENLSWPAPSLNVIDCVLSLNRDYLKFVRPRVKRFRERNPHVHSLAELAKLIRSFSSPLDFSIDELDYRDTNRAQTLLGVTEYLIDELQDHEGSNEADRLASWARQARPGDYLLVSVKGFALAGFQYLRMLFGAQTTKPDRHIRRFVGSVVGHTVTDIQAVLLLEKAAKRIRIPLRDIDAQIWKELATKPKQKGLSPAR
jgi:hypothetical protein